MPLHRFLPLALALLVTLFAPAAHAVVGRHDVDASAYQASASDMPALVDLPGEGHGVLIAPQWVVTAAHAVAWQPHLRQVVINGVPRDVERVVMHPGYRAPPQSMIDDAMKTGEAVLILVLIAQSDDVALIRLAAPVTDVAPVALFRGGDEFGRMVTLMGKGASGDGASGHDPRGPNRTALRRANNTVTSAHERWFCYQFDAPPNALPLEGMMVNGDSGGPVLVDAEGGTQLVGLASWKFFQGDVRTGRPGQYGQVACNLRISHYAGWIDATIAANAPPAR